MEWSLVQTSEYSSVGTSNSSGDDISNSYMLYQAQKNKIEVIRDVHSHSLGNSTPSPGDINLARQYAKQPYGAPDTKFYIYDKMSYHSFNSSSSTFIEPVILGKRRK